MGEQTQRVAVHGPHAPALQRRKVEPRVEQPAVAGDLGELHLAAAELDQLELDLDEAQPQGNPLTGAGGLFGDGKSDLVRRRAAGDRAQVLIIIQTDAALSPRPADRGR